jgi:hypothetical protein
VYAALRDAVSPGELAKVEAHLPKDVAGFLPPAVRMTGGSARSTIPCFGMRSPTTPRGVVGEANRYSTDLTPRTSCRAPPPARSAA